MTRRWPAILTGIAAAWVFWTAFDYFCLGGARHRTESAWFILAACAIAAATLNGATQPVSRGPAAPTSLQRGVALVVVLVSTVIVYWPAAGLGLLSDDYVLLARSGRELADPHAWEHFRPLPLLVWKAIYPVGGAAALHVLNILLHGVNAWMVGLLSRRLGHSPLVAVQAAAMFLLFPAAVEPVAWNSGIFDVATVFFGLLYLHGASASSLSRQTLGLAALAAAMLTKETAVVLPLIAVAIGWRAGISRRTLVISFALAATYAAMRLWSGADATAALLPAAGSSMRYAIKEMLVRPFAALAVPWTRADIMGPMVSRITLGVAPVAVILALIAAYTVTRRAGLRPLTNVAWVFLGIAPLASLFFVNDDLEGSRYLYLPLCGWCLFIGDLLDGVTRERFRVIFAGALLTGTILLGVWGIRRHLEPWQESARLRNTLIAEAKSALQQSRCRRALFEDVPADNRGAQLFRNGFEQALGQVGVSTADTACRFAWTGMRFERR